MSLLRNSHTPTIPTRSPFRIRDSQLAKIQKLNQVDDWSMALELNDMWNLKSTHSNNTKYKALSFSPSFAENQLLTQLLISQALLASNDYKLLTFDEMEKLKKELLDTHEHLMHLSRNIKLETHIKNISKTLENVNLKNSRHSILYLQNEYRFHEQKLKLMINQVEMLKKRETELQRTLLEHTAAVLNKGLHNKMKLSTNDTIEDEKRIFMLENQLSEIAKRVNFICTERIQLMISPNSSTIQKLLELEKYANRQDNISSKNYLNEHLKFEINNPLDIRFQKNQLLSRLIDMEHISTKLFTQMTHYPQREMALKLELLQYKTESIEMQIWKKKRQRDEDPEQISNSKLQYQNQLNEQVKFYQSEIEQQSILIQRDQQLCQRLENDCERLETENNRLEQVLKEKSRILDTKDNKITQLNNEITNCQYNPNSSKIKENKMKQDFEIKDKNWASHTAQMEDKFDLLLDNFDKLTNKAIEFDSHRMKYDRTIEELNKTIYQLELELMNEKVEKIGYGGNFNSDSPATTVGLRKEFRILVADIKRTHQLRMEQEAEEIQRLKVQIEELQRSNNVTFQYKQRNDMAIQTEAYTNN